MIPSQVSSCQFLSNFYKWDFFFFVSGKKNFSICLYADSNRCQIGFSAKRSRNFFCQDFFMKNIITTRGNLTMQILVSSWVSCKYSWDFFLLLTKVLPKNRADLRVVGGQKISFLDHDLLRWYFLQLCEKIAQNVSFYNFNFSAKNQPLHSTTVKA